MKKQRTFLPQDIIINIENIEPYFNNLISREILSVAHLEKWLQDRGELSAILEENFAWRYIKMTCDTQNESLVKDFQYFATEIEPKLAPLQNQLDKKFIDSGFIDELNNDKYFILIRATKQRLQLFREENIPLYTQLQIKQQEFGAISGNMTVSIDNHEYTLEQASNFLKDQNREVRESAYKKISERRLQDSSKLNTLFNELVALRHQIALNAGFDNFRDYSFAAMGRFDYTAKDCEDFHLAIEKQVVPLLQNIAAKRQQDLKVDSLKPWDNDVDTSGKPMLKPFNSGEELIDKSIQCFEKINPYMGNCLKTMKENNLFDVVSRKGKSPGGYNYPLSETGMPFIFMNSANSMRDLCTMMHEGGHAVHTFISSDLELNDFKNLTSEIAELASMSMELISMSEWEIFFDNKDDLQRARYEQMKDVIKTLPWVAVIDAFQHWIYLNPTHTEQERYAAWDKIFDRFGAGFVNWDNLEEVKHNLWQKQLHLFEVPFYYIEYAIAQLGAIAVWKNYTKNPQETLTNYLSALKLGYTKPIGQIYNTAGIKFDFSENYVKELMSFVSTKMNS